MSVDARAGAARDLTELVVRLGRTHSLLAEQARIPVTDFGGVAGEAFRIHASHSAATAVQAASDLALLTGALAALGRELAGVGELRRLADGLPPDQGAEVRGRADERERRAQTDWRTAVAQYEQRRWPMEAPAPPVVSQPPVPPTRPPALAAGPAQPRQPEPPSLEAEIVESSASSGAVRPADAIVWPPGWRVRRQGPALVATSPASSSAGGPATLEWRRGSPAPITASAVLEDEDDYDIAGHPVTYRRFGDRVDGVEIVREEWRWHAPGGDMVLTGTVPRADYLAVCDLFEDVAASVDPAP